MIDRPASRGVLVVGKCCLATNQQPPARRAARVLVAREQTREPRDQRLQDILGLVRGLAHLDQLIIAAQEKDAAVHQSCFMLETSRECHNPVPVGRVGQADRDEDSARLREQLAPVSRDAHAIVMPQSLRSGPRAGRAGWLPRAER